MLLLFVCSIDFIFYLSRTKTRLYIALWKLQARIDGFVVDKAHAMGAGLTTPARLC
jgi:hypothetical protein